MQMLLFSLGLGLFCNFVSVAEPRRGMAYGMAGHGMAYYKFSVL